MIHRGPIASANFAFIDVETTGLSPTSHRIVEAACLVVQGGRELHSFATLVNPGRSIPLEASAIHGITDEDVANAPTIDVVLPRLRELCADAVVVAHNARFDLGFLPELNERPTLCSLRLARALMPEAPNHKNQGLRAFLKIADPRLVEGDAHRALADVIVTSHVFAHCVRRHLAAGGADEVAALMALAEGRLPTASRA